MNVNDSKNGPEQPSSKRSRNYVHALEYESFNKRSKWSNSFRDSTESIDSTDSTLTIFGIYHPKPIHKYDNRIDLHRAL